MLSPEYFPVFEPSLHFKGFKNRGIRPHITNTLQTVVYNVVVNVTNIRELRVLYERTSETGDSDKTSIVNIRLPNSLIASIDEFAKSMSVTRSRYLRDLIEVGHYEMRRLVVVSYGDGQEEAVWLHEVDPAEAEKEFPEDFNNIPEEYR